jgi:hypothetical protein
MRERNGGLGTASPVTRACDTVMVPPGHCAEFCLHTLIGYLSTDGATVARPGLVKVTGGVALSSAAHRWLVWLTHGMRPAGHRGAERLKRAAFGLVS